MQRRVDTPEPAENAPEAALGSALNRLAQLRQGHDTAETPASLSPWANRDRDDHWDPADDALRGRFASASDDTAEPPPVDERPIEGNAVAAREYAPPKKAAPLISEEELDALFAKVDESRVVLDDLGEEPRWSEPYWTDVDIYLSQAPIVDEALMQSVRHEADRYDLHDLEIRDPEPDLTPDTYFWMPGDDELAVAGAGGDLFIVSASEAAATVLVEDGATWSMRTGGSARIDEVVVSLSEQLWSAVDAMRWRRIAVLSGFGEVRVTQTRSASRRVVAMGVLTAASPNELAVRLVRAGDDGEEEFEVIRPGVPDWPFSDL